MTHFDKILQWLIELSLIKFGNKCLCFGTRTYLCRALGETRSCFRVDRT